MYHECFNPLELTTEEDQKMKSEMEKAESLGFCDKSAYHAIPPNSRMYIFYLTVVPVASARV